MAAPSRWRLFADLSESQALALLNDYVAAVPTRSATLLRDVGSMGGPTHELDYSRESLVPLWTWFVATQRLPEQPVHEDEMRRVGAPWWFDFHPRLGMKLGPPLADLVTNLSAYFASCIMRERPLSTWALGPDPRGADFRKPLLNVDGGRTWGCDTTMISIVLRALDQRRERTGAMGLRERFDFYLHRPAAPPLTRNPRLFDVSDGDTPGFTHVLEIDDVVSHEEEAIVLEFVKRLQTMDGVRKTLHEDREVVLVDAPGLSNNELADLAERLWAKVARVH